MTEIKWQEPPADARHGRDPHVDEVAAALKANPGKWALVDRCVGSSRGSTWKRRGLQVTMRSVEDRPTGSAPRFDVYARFVPEADA